MNEFLQFTNNGVQTFISKEEFIFWLKDNRND